MDKTFAPIGLQSFPNFRLTLSGLETKIRRDWCLCSYLIINWNLKELVDPAERELPETFAKNMASYVYAYMYENKMPPAAIAQTVFNVAEDTIAGRPVMLRAGDYIACQNFFRAGK